jgi:hypothetical protein
MRKYQATEVNEAQLEDLVRQGPELIEEGLRYVDHQRRTGNGRLDVLLVDSGGAIVVAELKVVEDDNMLVQALDYYDYISANREALARIYAAAKIDPTQPARLLLVAPSFSVALVNRVKWFSLSISLFAYRCVRLDGDEQNALLPVYVEIKPSPVVESLPAKNIDDVLGYITDLGVRGKATELLNVLRALGPSISLDPVQGAVSVKKHGKVFAYVWPRRKWFIFGHRAVDGQWGTVDVEPHTDLTPIRESFEASFKKGA